jgi:hypothetical protein
MSIQPIGRIEEAADRLLLAEAGASILATFHRVARGTMPVRMVTRIDFVEQDPPQVFKANDGGGTAILRSPKWRERQVQVPQPWVYVQAVRPQLPNDAKLLTALETL